MSERNNKSIDPAFGHIDACWDDTRTRRNLRRVSRRLVRRRVGTVIGSVALALAVAGGGYRALRRPAMVAPYELDSIDGQQRVRFFDGSSVLLFDDRSRLEVASVGPRAIVASLTAGMGHFEVTPNPARSFSVRVDLVTVSVLGTSFNLEREGTHVRVTVERGRVEVGWPSGSRQLTAGQTGWFPEEFAVEPTVAPAASDPETPGARSNPDAPAKRSVGHAVPLALRTSFHEHASKGDYAAAYRVLSQAPNLLDNTVEDLMLAADAARLSGHPGEALPYLRRIVEKHDRDASAPLAAFTLGRILLSELRRPGEAADAFALTRRLAPGGSLAPDALAREIESANKAGASERARRLAEEYRDRYPTGRRLEEVRRYGGI